MLAYTAAAVLAAGITATIPYVNLDGTRWHDDYGRAVAEAKASGKMLVVYFTQGLDDSSARQFEKELQDSGVGRALAKYVCVRLPLNARIRVQGESTGLLEHAAFREMLGRPGIAILDFENPRDAHFGHVVSAFPFDPGRSHKAATLRVILGLPKGSLTQRTLIYAVRIHPDRPASTQGEFNPVLADEAEDHSRHQARIRLQGHHAWESRFHQINARLSDGGAGAQEVVAESWPGETLVEAAIECVNSWRQSPGHWSAVRARHRAFGYDMKRGSNGVWYATGIFARLSGRR